jgi:hypothetical protein
MKTVPILSSIFALAAATPVLQSSWFNITIPSLERPTSIDSVQRHITRDLGSIGIVSLNFPNVKKDLTTIGPNVDTMAIDTTWTIDTTIPADTTMKFDAPKTIDVASKPSRAADDLVDCILHPTDCVSSLTSDLKVAASASPISRHVRKDATPYSIPLVTCESFSGTGEPVPTPAVISIIQGKVTMTVPEASLTSVFDYYSTEAASITSRIEDIASEASSALRDVHSLIAEASMLTSDWPLTFVPQATGVQTRDWYVLYLHAISRNIH